MRATLANRLRSASLSAVPPPTSSPDYSQDLARIARRILYRSPLPSKAGYPIYILNAAAFPDTSETDYDALLPYVLARLPGEDELLSGTEYEVIFFAGGGEGTATRKSGRPGWAWFVQAYNVLSRAMRKRIQRLYIVHEKSWVRVLVEMFSTIVSPKFRKKVVHVSTLTGLALHVPLEDLLIPSSAYLFDRRLSPDIHVPYVTGRRAFSARHPFPKSMNGQPRLPRVLRETTSFILQPGNIKQAGIFRIPPHAKLVEVLKEAYDRSQRFIVWKEGDEQLLLPKAYSTRDSEQIVNEFDQIDSYGVALAAGLIKTWYRELRLPIFPQNSYPDIRRIFGDREAEMELPDLIAMTSPEIEVCPLPSISRTILTQHLLPLLARVESYKDANQMTAQNLAICFAPTLLCGPDQLEDMKMTSLVSRYLEAAIEAWEPTLRESCGIDKDAFNRALQPPENRNDYEDPLDTHYEDDLDKVKEYESQTDGIVLLDQEDGVAPALPPRRTAAEVQPAAMAESSGLAIRRRPAPALEVPPRYSTLLRDEPATITDTPSTYPPADGFAPPSSTFSSSPFSDPPSSTLPEKDLPLAPSDPSLIMPKRKAVPTESLETSPTTIDGTNRSRNNTITRKPLVPPKSASLSSTPDLQTAPPIIQPPFLDDKIGSDKPTFAKPTWPASASSRSVSLPSVTIPRKPSPTIPGIPKPRTPSPGLMQRMPSFEQGFQTAKVRSGSESASVANSRNVVGGNGGDCGNGGRGLGIGGRSVRERSVDDLRRIYEERVGTVKGLARAASK